MSHNIYGINDNTHNDNKKDRFTLIEKFYKFSLYLALSDRG